MPTTIQHFGGRAKLCLSCQRLASFRVKCQSERCTIYECQECIEKHEGYCEKHWKKRNRLRG